MRKAKKVAAQYVLKSSVNQVMQSKATLPSRPLVFSAKPIKTAVKIRSPTRVLSVHDTLVRIQQEADPIGFLISVQRGDLIPVHYVNEDNEVVTTYEGASLAERVQIAKFLTNRVLPSLTVTKHMMETPSGDTDGKIGTPGQPSFAAMVAAAASRELGARANGRQAHTVTIDADDKDEFEHRNVGAGDKLVED